MAGNAEAERGEEQEQQPPVCEEGRGKPSKARKSMWMVYVAHALSTWGDNLWAFAGGVYMMELSASGDLRLTAIYGLVIALAVIASGAAIGRWIDNTRRLTAARTCLVVQNASVATCAIVLSVFLSHSDTLPAFWNTVTVTVVIAFSSASKLASTGTTIVVQKDWLVVICDGDLDRLAAMNSVLRTIGLTTLILAPVAAGQLFSLTGYVWTGVVVAAWNLASVGLEYTLLHLIYRSYPALAEKKHSRGESDELRVEEESSNLMAEEGKEKEALPERSALAPLKSTCEGWKDYFQHSVRYAGIGLALLYMTVLGFDNITYGYVLTQGIPESVLGVLVALNAASGVLGSLAYPHIRRRIGIERTGLFGMFFLVTTSSAAVLSNFLPGSPFMLNFRWSHLQSENVSGNTNNADGDSDSVIAVCVLMSGIIAARFGLWITDLTINQILQERVEEERRGVINGVQDSMNNSLDLLKCVLVILLPQPRHFGFLVILSFSFVSSGWLMYAQYSRQQRGHLFHFSKLKKVLIAP